MRLLESDEPRVVKQDLQEHVVVITDGCYERESRTLQCGLGGVFVDTVNGKKQFFSCELSDAQRQLLGELSKKQIFFEAETLCAVLAHFFSIQCLVDRKAFLYVDNEGTKFSLIRGTSENSTVDLPWSNFC